MGNLTGPKGKVISAAPAEGEAPFLRIYLKGKFLRSYRITLGIVTAGRDPTNALVLEDRWVSRRHFQLEFRTERQLILQDLQSSNGTYVNGKRVTRCPLTHGDTIQLGDLRVVVSHKAAARSNVIPFPESRTEPQIDVAALESAEPPLSHTLTTRLEEPAEVFVPSPPPKAAELKRPVSRVPTALLTVIVVGSAALLAWGILNVTRHRAVVQIVEVLPGISKIEPTAPPLIEVSPPPASPKKEIRRSTVNREKEDKGLPSSLDSLWKASKGANLAGADQLSKNEPSNRLTASLKDVKQEGARSVQLEIELPRMQELEAMVERQKKERKTASPVSVAELERYQSSFRNRISGIEGCYAQHSKDGGAGAVSVWLRVASSGMVVAAGIDRSSFQNAALESCMVQKVKQVKGEPPPWDGLTLSYSFRFGRQRISFE